MTVVAVLLGVRPPDQQDPFPALTGDFEADSAALIRRRIAEAKRQDAEAAAAGDETAST